MAVFKKEDEKAKIRIALNAFFASKGTTLYAFCNDNGIDYSATHQKINRGHVDEEFVNGIIKKVDKLYKLQRFGSTFMVSKL